MASHTLIQISFKSQNIWVLKVKASYHLYKHITCMHSLFIISHSVSCQCLCYGSYGYLLCSRHDELSRTSHGTSKSCAELKK
ncbi:hypothetical protein EB796_007170 [Bugula neritina]|uniref:Uncharacterized protein n=1 Tax=Bugula neritina TaxID=10212 RepID=A0A7J7K8C8_BUGNE|nr:hypothetical protein EB796_007170 [Bugula neritina]